MTLDWTYQPKPKRRRMGQGLTYLYAYTENPRGGRSFRFLNSYNNTNGSLEFTGVDSATGGINLTTNQVPSLMIPVQQAQAGSLPQAMYFNQLSGAGRYQLLYVT